MAATYDLSMSRAQPAGEPAIQQLIGPGDMGQIITGGSKLAQKYVVILMTEKGSIPYATTRGSNFVNILQMSGGGSEGDILTAFAGAQIDINRQLPLNTNDPLEEQFVKAVVTGIMITSSGALLSFNIITNGAGLSVTLPLNFVLQ